MPEAFGVEADVARLGDQPPEEGDAVRQGAQGLLQGQLHVVGAADKLVERKEERRVGGVLDHRHHAAGVALPVLAFEGERGGREDDGRDPEFGEVLGGLQRGATSGSAAEGGHEDGEPHAFEVLVEQVDGVLRREASGDDVAARAVAGEPVAAQEDERLVGLAGGGVGVEEKMAHVRAEGPVDVAGDGRSGGPDADQDDGGIGSHLKNLPRMPSKSDFSS